MLHTTVTYGTLIFHVQPMQKLHMHTNAHLCLTWAVPGLSGRDLSHSLPPSHSHGFQQCLLKRVTVVLTLCSVVYFSLFATPPLLHTFFLSLLLLLNLFFCSTCLSSLLLNRVWSCGHAHSSCLRCTVSLLTSTTSSSSSSFPSSKLALFLSHFWHTTDGLLLCILLSVFTSTCGCLSLSLFIFVTFLCCPVTLVSTNYSSPFFYILSFSLNLWLSLCLSSLLPHFGPLPPQAGAPTPPDLSARQQSPPPASPLSRSNLCSLLYSAPSGMAVVSGKFSASSWMQPPPSPSSQPFLLPFTLCTPSVTSTDTPSPPHYHHSHSHALALTRAPGRPTSRPAAHSVQVEARWKNDPTHRS